MSRPAPLNVFVSHRMEDRPIAIALTTILERLSRGGLVAHVCERIPGGREWRQWILQYIGKSNLLIFLYTTGDAEWGWCLFELGLFQGGSREKSVVCIKNAFVTDLPSPLADYQAYDADREGIAKFVDDLLDKGVFTEGQRLNDRLYQDDREDLAKGVDQIVSSFLPSRIEVEYFERRACIEFTETGDLADTRVMGTPVTMQLLGLSEAGGTWRQLYGQFTRMQQATWLDELRESIPDIKTGTRPKEVMTAFTIRDGRSFIPVLARTERLRPNRPDDPAIPKRVYVGFVPTVKTPAEPHPEQVLRVWSGGQPTSVVRIRWRKKVGLEYRQDDMEGGPVVCAVNPPFAKLFDFDFDQFERLHELNVAELMKRMAPYVRPEHIALLLKDQGDVWANIFKGAETAEATAPLQLNQSHEAFPNAAFLPTLVSKQLVGSESGPHEMYLLVTYVKQFWPLDDPRSPWFPEAGAAPPAEVRGGAPPREESAPVTAS